MKLGWIARDKTGELNIFYGSEPFLMEDREMWNNEEGLYIDIPSDSFPEITFENSPQQVEINLIK